MQALDEAIGEVVDGYRTLGMFNDTVFLFLGDNGGMNAEGGFNRWVIGQTPQHNNSLIMLKAVSTNTVDHSGDKRRPYGKVCELKQ